MEIPVTDKMTKNPFCQEKSAFRPSKTDIFGLKLLLKITTSKLKKEKVKLT